MSEANAPWRRRLSELGRGTGKTHAPLFAPLLYGVAAQIEALSPAEVTADPTRLGKCLVELRRVLRTAPLVVAAPTAMEAEALGARVDRGVWPPQVLAAAPPDAAARTDFDAFWSRSEALLAALETCRRLSATQAGEPVLLAALTGPESLLAELLPTGTAPDATAYEHAGRALSALSRQFAQAGASAILLCERRAPADAAAWSAALGTIANIARFHRIPALLAFDGLEPGDWPAATVACPSPAAEAAAAKPHGVCVPADIAGWPALSGTTGAARLVVTAREVAADVDLEELIEACEAALAMEQER